jgi:SWI/SNF-related matrix-associated actin-dependent regulator of chromatin subfamily A3
VRQDPLQASDSISSSNITNGFVELGHAFSGEYCWLKLRDGESFGCVSSRTSQVLKRLTTFSCVELDCIAPISCMEKARTQWKRSGKTELLVQFNVYGHTHSASAVGDILAAARLFLQVPTYDKRCAIYDNPQYLKLPDVAHIILEEPPVSTPHTSAAHEQVSHYEIESLLDHIPQSNHLREGFTSDKIRTPLIK